MPNENELERTMKEIEQTGPPSSKPPTESDQQAVEVYESGGSFASIAAAIRAAERRGIERAAVVAKHCPEVCDCADRIAAAIRALEV